VPLKRVPLIRGSADNLAVRSPEALNDVHVINSGAAPAALASERRFRSGRGTETGACGATSLCPRRERTGVTPVRGFYRDPSFGSLDVENETTGLHRPKNLPLPVQPCHPGTCAAAAMPPAFQTVRAIAANCLW